MMEPTPRAVAIVPAAGESQRMGTAKLLLPWGAETVIETTIGAWRRSCVEAVIVVVSPGNEPLANACRAAGATVVVPHAPPPDMKASLQQGIRYLNQSHDADAFDCFLVAPADMPWIEPATIDRLAAEFAAEVTAEFAAEFTTTSTPIVAPTHNGRRGHPIALAWPLAAEVLQLSNEETLKTIVDRHNAKEIECGPTVLGDLDTPNDYRQARSHYNK